MENVDRAQWMAILEVAAQQSGNEVNEEWEWLLDQLSLSADHFLAILEVIRQGRWRKAKNPKAYVKTVAEREAKKMCLLSAETGRWRNSRMKFPGKRCRLRGENLIETGWNVFRRP